MTSHIEEEKEALPEQWEMRVDPKTGMPYYLNHAEQFTTWDDPRLVSHPRSMLNTMGSMLRRSASPIPDSARRNRTRNESTSIPFNHHFLSPTPQDSHFTRSLPRTRGFTQPPFGSNDSWFKSGFDEPEDNFFDEASWPIRSHSLRMREQSPFNAQAESAGTRWSPSRRLSPEHSPSRDQHSVIIPITREGYNPEAEHGGEAKERVIIPTQYKQKINQREERRTEADLPPKKSDSPRPKLLKQEDTSRIHVDEVDMMAEDAAAAAADATAASAGDDSNERAVLQRMSSVYDNTDSTSGSDDSRQEIDDEDSNCSTNSEVCDDITQKAHITSANSDNSNEGENNNTKISTAVDTERHEENDDSVADDDTETKDILLTNIRSSYESINKVRLEVEGYKPRVKKFNNSKQSKEFRYLDEMLTRCQLALDNVSTHGDIDLRKKRKETVNEIDSLLSLLENNCSKRA